MIKHTDYDNPCLIKIYKCGDNYRLIYQTENYEFFCDKDELLEELGEHLDNMKG